MELQVLPWIWKDSYHQKCYVSYDILQKIGAKIGQYILVTWKTKSFVCCVWPNADIGHHSLSFCETVSFNNKSVSNVNENSLKVLSPVSANKVYVNVFLTKIENVIQTKRDEQSMKTLSHQVSNLIQHFCISHNVIIDCKHSSFAKLVGIRYIKVDKVIANKCKESSIFGLIDTKTEINIEEVHSQDWYRQLTSEIRIPPLGGLESVLNMLRDLIKLPLIRKEAFKIIGERPPRGILLRGPPGCGKTSLVRYLARTENVFLVAVNGPEIFGPLPGETEGKLRKLFNQALLRSTEGPCILFIDEIDSVCPKGGKSGGLHNSRATAQLVALMDGLKDEDFLIMAATNRPSAIDPALRRPGRFDREVCKNIWFKHSLITP